MGAMTFFQKAKGKTAAEAFRNAVTQAEWDHGHGGYTGTIAEKSEFTLITVPKGEDPEAYAEQLMDNDDDRIADKWGPAGCVKLSKDEYLFFGWASS